MKQNGQIASAMSQSPSKNRKIGAPPTMIPPVSSTGTQSLRSALRFCLGVSVRAVRRPGLSLASLRASAIAACSASPAIATPPCSGTMPPARDLDKSARRRA
jgi:hypothetical protein